MERRFASLGQPKSFSIYDSMDEKRFEFCPFEDNVRRLALAWRGEGDYSEQIQGYMSVAPFVGKTITPKITGYRSITLGSPQEVMEHPLLLQTLGKETVQILSEMIRKPGYKGGLELRTNTREGHLEPSFSPALGVKDRNLFLAFNRCTASEAYSLLFEMIQ